MDIAGYRIEGEAGRGGWCVVHRGTELTSGRPVAIKAIAPEHAHDAELRARFEHERRVAEAVQHPNLTGALASGEGYIVMPWVEGRPLSELAPLDPASAARVVAQVGAALDALHAAGFAHRDVKPSNVLIDAGGHAWLTDLGLAKPLGPDPWLTADGRWLGTVDFAAPEQIRGLPADARSDVYSLGCVLGYALTGGVPFPRPGPEATMHAHIYEPLAPLGPPLMAFNTVLGRALAKQPEGRYRSAGELGRAALVAAGLERRPRSSSPWGIAAAVLSGIVLFAGGIALVVLEETGGDDEPPAAEIERSPERPVGDVPLRPVGAHGGSGTASVTDDGSDMAIEIRAQLPPLVDRRAVYEAWLAGGAADPYSLGWDRPSRRGELELSAGVAPEYLRHRYIEITVERIPYDGSHSGRPVVRGSIDAIRSGG